MKFAICSVFYSLFVFLPLLIIFRTLSLNLKNWPSLFPFNELLMSRRYEGENKILYIT